MSLTFTSLRNARHKQEIISQASQYQLNSWMLHAILHNYPDMIRLLLPTPFDPVIVVRSILLEPFRLGNLAYDENDPEILRNYPSVSLRYNLDYLLTEPRIFKKLLPTYLGQVISENLGFLEQELERYLNASPESLESRSFRVVLSQTVNKIPTRDLMNFGFLVREFLENEDLLS